MTGREQIPILDNRLSESSFDGLHVVGRNKPEKNSWKENLANHSPYVVAASMLVLFL